MSLPDFFIFAGEPSGDQYGEELLHALLEKNPEATMIGVGGPKMRRLSFDCILPMEAFQVMGFVDVFLTLPKLIRQFHFVKNAILERKPKKVILIDYPGFNLRLASSLRKSGYRGKVCHYICPSVWAWGKKRIPLMANHLDMLLSILPFEKECFTHTLLPVHYVGNPLVHQVASHTLSSLSELKGKKVLGIFPGSRKKELMRNLNKQLTVARSLLTIDPEVYVTISIATPHFLPLIKQTCANVGIDPLFVPHEKSYDLMSLCHLALATSGSVTLELALHQVPTVVTYGISPLDLIIAKHILRIILPFYCLVNIIAKKEVFPELIGPHFTVDALFELASHLLIDEKRRKECFKELHRVRKLLTDKKASLEAAHAITSL